MRAGGLHRQKARVIKRLLRAVRKQVGELSLEALRDMPDIEAERLLTLLPGLSWKGTRCVLLYSLHRQVLPVDGNTFRILKRAGVLPQSAVYRRRSLHDGVQEAVDPPRRRSFHVNLVIHGQRVCLPRAPNCPECPAQAVCAMRGIPRAVVKAARSGAPLARGARASGGHRLDEQTSQRTAILKMPCTVREPLYIGTVGALFRAIAAAIRAALEAVRQLLGRSAFRQLETGPQDNANSGTKTSPSEELEVSTSAGRFPGPQPIQQADGRKTACAKITIAEPELASGGGSDEAAPKDKPEKIQTSAGDQSGLQLQLPSQEPFEQAVAACKG